MADENTAVVPQPEQDQPARARRIETGRSGGGGGGGGRERETGGFRIRLSDNELRAAQAVQEAFQLRSTVAALGFSIRTVAQLLEQGQLDALLAEHRAQGGAPRNEAATRGDGQRAKRAPAEGRGERRSSRPDPFARPSRPQAPAPELEAEAPELVAEEAAEPSEQVLEVVISEPEQATSQAEVVSQDSPDPSVPPAESAETQP
ncbi:hypothetical protein KBY93_02850 [Synechococcus sp. J7-Johnson]|uniref:hypothetical protein n=1 Tax=Synechococcus sp. J7-Johnson TaxID=2823737 RepID=UPI0020CCF59C|nr:hypothetical protein [Synechococcus sp. J7-Johnson]MCP9839571.1 hypothetical protein [Synechococcus sp. J7-Johnson]